MKTPRVIPRRLTVPVALSLAAALVVTGCSSDQPTDGQAPETAAAEPTAVPTDPWPTEAPPEDPQDWIAEQRAASTEDASPQASQDASASSSATSSTAAEPAADDTEIAVAATGTGTDYTAAGAGLSFEATDLADERLSAQNPDLVRLLGSLEQPTLRFGGNATDRRFFFTADDEPQPTDWPLEDGEQITTVTPEDLERVAGLAEEVDAQVILSANLGEDDPQRAADLARHGEAAFGDRLAGLMIGNEPNGFAELPENPVPIRDADWGPEQYAQAAGEYVDAVREVAPDLVIAAPGAYDAEWWATVTQSELGRSEPDDAALAVHQYPLPECGDPGDPGYQAGQAPTVENITSARTRERVDQLVGEAAVMAQDAQMPLWITETSASSCAGTNQVTETLAAGVYSADYLLRTQQLGATRVAFHSSLAPCRGGAPMSALCSSGTLQSPGEAFVPRTNGLALALAGGLPAGEFLDVELAQQGGQPVEGADGAQRTAYAVRHEDGSISVVVLDFRDPQEAADNGSGDSGDDGSGAADTVRITLPEPVQQARASSLSGDSWEAHYPETTLFDDAQGPSGASSADPERPATQDADGTALDLEAALTPVGEGLPAVDGFGLPVLPESGAPVPTDAGGTVLEAQIPAGSATVITTTPL